MDNGLRLGVANLSYIVGWSVFSGLVLNLVNLPAVAVEVDSTITVAQETPKSTPPIGVNRPILRIGSQGTAVSELQAALKLLGYYIGAVDGVYQESTAIAVSQFQQAAGLRADGIAGPATWSRLFPNTASSGTPAPTSTDRSATAFPVPSMLQTANPPNQPDKTGNNFPPATTTTPATTTPATTTPATTNRQSTAVTLPILREGMRGPAVAQLQERLRTLGFLRSSADGVFGEATHAAVIAAQERFKIKPDGIVGPATWRALLR